MGTYFENPGMPTDDEWGVYCPHGEKIVEADRGPSGKDVPIGSPVEPWPCSRIGCTREAFEQAAAEMEAELAEADKRAMGCMGGPGHAEPCEGDRGNL